MMMMTHLNLQRYNLIFTSFLLVAHLFISIVVHDFILVTVNFFLNISILIWKKTFYIIQFTP